jgi:putative PIG3 family NAD(P)H quinone oxidoreductase
MTVPSAMRAIVHGGDAPLRLEEAPTPQPGAGEVLIRVQAAGVNRPDLLQRSGAYPPPPGASPRLGLEAAGVVAAVGSGVSRWREGDAVCVLLPGGGYAEYAVAPEGAVLPIPAGASVIEAAALPETAFTVWVNVFDACRLQSGERILVHGGASGIGTTAIQMAAAHGATVFATAGDAEKVALCETLGATRAINYRTEDFEAVIRDAGGVDVILDMVGAPYLQKNLNILNLDGRLSQIAFLQGSRGEIDLMRLMMRRLVLTGSTLRARTNEDKARIAAGVEALVWPWVAQGKVRPVIDSVFPLADADAAHARMQAGTHAGKIVLTVEP